MNSFNKICLLIIISSYTCSGISHAALSANQTEGYEVANKDKPPLSSTITVTDPSAPKMIGEETRTIVDSYTWVVSPLTSQPELKINGESTNTGIISGAAKSISVSLTQKHDQEPVANEFNVTISATATGRYEYKKPGDETWKLLKNFKNVNCGSIVVKFYFLKLDVSSSGALFDGDDSETPCKAVLSSALAVDSYAWTWSIESTDYALNPAVCFSTPSESQTKIVNAHWYATPAIEHLHPPSYCRYIVKCTARVKGLTLEDDDQFLACLPNPAGITFPPKYNVDMSKLIYKDSNGVYRVNTSNSAIIVKLPQPGDGVVYFLNNTSQFYNKAEKHEAVHVEQYATGTASHIWDLTKAYNKIKDLSSTSEDRIKSLINAALYGLDMDLREEVVNMKEILEDEAYQVSDSIPPYYFYQKNFF